MRSKPRARKVAQGTTNDPVSPYKMNQLSRSQLEFEHLDPEQLDGHADSPNSVDDIHMSSDDGNYSNGTQPSISQLNGDIDLPEDLELHPSGVSDGMGIWVRHDIPPGAKFGPFVGTVKSFVQDPSQAWKLVDEYGKVKGWMDHSNVENGHWMKYVRSCSQPSNRNLVAVHLDNQVYYRGMRGLVAGEELLVSTKEPVYPEMHMETMKFIDEEQRQFPCYKCGEVFRSKVALRRHETYVCNNSHAIFSKLNQHLKSGPSSATVTTTSITHPLTFSRETSQHQRGLNPITSKVQEMIQDAHRGDLLSPTQRAIHELQSHHHQNIDSYTSSLDDGLGSMKHFPCEHCNKVYSDPIQLQKHIRTAHVGARSHTCVDCGKTFATSSGLKQHQHIHSSVKPFQCEVCLKAYTQFSNLCRHKRMHADCRQQIKCKDCGQTFSTMTSLGKHKRFCQGMLGNGARMAFPTATSGLPIDKSSSITSSSNHTKIGSYPNPYASFYAPRPAFPFFPPVGAGFPMFPAGHPMASMMSAGMHDGKLNHEKEERDLKKDSGIERSLDSDMDDKRRWGSDHSNVSTEHSDFPRSDIDSEAESEHSFSRGLRESPRPLKTSSPALASPPYIREAHSHSAFDLSYKSRKDSINHPSTLSPSLPSHKQSTPKSEAPGEMLPLDLSYKVGKEDTPRKTHIFGIERETAVKEKDIKLSPAISNKSHSPATLPSMSPKGKPIPESPEKMHTAYPTTSASHMMGMYSRSLEKTNIEAYQEAARLMSMAPSRFAFPGMPAPFSPFHSGMHSMFPPSPLDHAKALAHPNFMRGPAAFPYVPGMNKLKDRYTCKFCGKIFPRSANLTRHLRTHTGEQPYKCKYCERSFSISSNLQRHIRNIHNKEKPFKCPICDRCFGQQTNLDRHLKKHEFEGPIVADSPTNEEHDDCDDIVAHNGDLGSTGSSGHTSELSSPLKEDKDVIDNSFSITGRMEKIEQHHSRPNSETKEFDDSLDRSEEELDWDNVEDDMEDEDEEDDIPPMKRPKLLNNNLPNNDYNGCVVNLTNGSS